MSQADGGPGLGREAKLEWAVDSGSKVPGGEGGAGEGLRDTRAEPGNLGSPMAHTGLGARASKPQQPLPEVN